jgi:chromosomal replication initiator protein
MENILQSAKTSISKEEVIQKLSLQKNPLISSTDVLKEIAKYFDVNLQDLRCKKQRRNLTKARKIASYLIHKKLNLPYSELQNLFEGISQPTLRGYCRQIEMEISESSEISLQIQEICKKLSLTRV